eukprot:7082332-Pyramimonas_sp.AAC.1
MCEICDTAPPLFRRRANKVRHVRLRSGAKAATTRIERSASSDEHGLACMLRTIVSGGSGGQ